MAEYYVYILTNRSGTLYVGVTNNLLRRVYEHKHKLIPGFTNRYNIDRLVYYEHTPDVRAAIAREKQIKPWRREKKVALIESMNRDWHDLSAEWFSEWAEPDANNARRDPSTPPARRGRSG
jgi:putative endonuclease